MNMTETIDFEKIEAIVRDAGEIARTRIEDLTISEKGQADFVTETDVKIQQVIQRKLEELYPMIPLMGEEAGASQNHEPVRWILDPIDGTTNYIYDYRHSAISLALCEENEITLGIVYNPFMEEFFTARKGKGVFLNGEPIRVRRTEVLSQALVAVGTSPYHRNLTDEVFDGIRAVYERSVDIRRTGSSALDLAYVACGRHDAFFEYYLKPWDYAAGSLLVTEAGGVICGIGEAIAFDRPTGILSAGTMPLMEEISDLLIAES